MAENFRNFEQGWIIIENAITKMKNILAGVEEEKFTATENMELYTIVFNLTSRSRNHQELYVNYRESLEEYISTVTLPALRLTQGEPMLREYVKRWKDYKKMADWLGRIFEPLDRYMVPPTLSEVGVTCFRDRVCREVETNVKTGVIKLIYQDREACREGKKFDRALLQNVLRLQTHLGRGIDWEDA